MLRSMFTFTPAQIRGVLWMLPLLAVFGIVISLADRPRFEKSFLELTDSVAAGKIVRPAVPVNDTVGMPAKEAASSELFVFDPNTATLQEFVRLGLDTRTAAGIIKYRERGKRFEIPADFATCYGVAIEDYTRLEPYIRIGEEFALKPTAGAVSRSVPGKPYVNSRETAPSVAGTTPAEPSLVELNGADSALLRSVSGIGEVLVVRIVEYRDRLGGFACKSQLAEIKGMSPENLERICEQIRVDSCEIQKIDINFAPHKTLVEQMGGHPYVTDVMLRKLLKNRQLKGGWSTIGEMVEENIMTDEDALRLSPYLLFRSE